MARLGTIDPRDVLPRLCPDILLAILEACDDLPTLRLSTLAAWCRLSRTYSNLSRTLLYRQIPLDLRYTAKKTPDAKPDVLLALETYPYLRPLVQRVSVTFSRPSGLSSHAWLWRPLHEELVERVLPLLVDVRHVTLSCDEMSSREDGGLLHWVAGCLPPQIERVDLTRLAEWSVRHVLQRIKERDPPISVRLTYSQYQRAEWVCALLSGKLLEEEYADIRFEVVESRESRHHL
ncbi:putative Chloride channel protein k [Rhodotorula toruloides ATCC 204091]|uniref:Putative chloride channel protein k n=1 Tax=Rhodotorula toruloides TaxID=5286 RepID=A0A2T0A8W3_RHOTO|nr:putative Chloride channel protein k [Rhodotorula toruloides ATCC 204091]KAK4336247.1 putative Chloride channel protein k [Rhodotorula toruloides]PRQ74455.1 putative chloride channel protein k [Rhodotorula toruloides]